MGAMPTKDRAGRIAVSAPESARDSASDSRVTQRRCNAAPGEYVPVIDRRRCEGKRDCIEVCPYGVFEVKRMEDADFLKLALAFRIKSRLHGRFTAYTPNANDCRACGLCVLACPEKAISLARGDVAPL